MQRSQILTRLVTHLSGGVRANLSDPNVLKIFPTGTNTPALISLPGPHDLFGTVQSLGLALVGTEEFWEANGLEHRIWHPCAYRKLYSPPDLPSLPPAELWGALAHAAGQAGDAASCRIMRHVSFALTAMARRLLNVSDEYGMQLQAALTGGSREDSKFSNTQVLDLFLACHGFLTEACAARDYLARFLAKHVYGGVDADSAATLLKRKKPSSYPIDAILEAANDKANPESWMVQMSEYRNIIAHRAPLNYLGGQKTMIELRFQPWMDEKTIPRVLMLIPANPFAPESGASVDALILLHAYCAHLLHFAAECARHSPYAPSLPQFDSSNILSMTRQG